MICYRSNEERAYQIYQNDEFVKLLDCQIHRHFKESLEFEPLFKEGFMGLKVDAQFLGEDVNIILAGSVYTDYKNITIYKGGGVSEQKQEFENENAENSEHLQDENLQNIEDVEQNKLQKDYDELKDKYMRANAEFENIKKNGKRKAKCYGLCK